MFSALSIDHGISNSLNDDEMMLKASRSYIKTWCIVDHAFCIWIGVCIAVEEWCCTVTVQYTHQLLKTQLLLKLYNVSLLLLEHIWTVFRTVAGWIKLHQTMFVASLPSKNHNKLCALLLLIWNNKISAPVDFITKFIQ